MSHRKTAVIIPMHNEEENITPLMRRLLVFKDLNIVIINDGSTDKTGQLADQFSKNEKVSVIHKENSTGLHAAYSTGIKNILPNFDGIITMDGDLSHQPEDLSALLNYAGNFDIVVGSRYLPESKIINWPQRRRFMSWVARRLSCLILKIRIKDSTSGFKYYSKEFLKSINFDNLSATGYAFQVEMIYKATKNNFSIKEVPITFREREKGSSKVDISEIIFFIKSLFLIRD